MPALLPEDHVLYVDFLYNLGEGGEDARIDWTGKGPLGKIGAWESVGQHLHWTKELEDLTMGYLRRAFGVTDKPGRKPPPVSSASLSRPASAAADKDPCGPAVHRCAHSSKR